MISFYEDPRAGKISQATDLQDRTGCSLKHQPGQEKINDKNRQQRRDYSRSSRFPYPFGSPCCGQSPTGSDNGNHRPKDKRFDLATHQVPDREEVANRI